MESLTLYPPLTRRMKLCFGLAVAIHLLIIVGVGFPVLRAPLEKTLRVTLSTSSLAPIEEASQVASSAQTGDDEISERKRSEAFEQAPRIGSQDDTQSGPSGQTGEPSPAILATDAVDRSDVSRESGIQAVKGGDEASPLVRGAEQAQTSTASSDLRAAYLEAWRHAVEDIGNQQFPAELLRGDPARQLILEVWLSSTGELLGTRVRRSSGKPELDLRARSIIEDAAPYAKFPPALAARHESLSFAYEWRFLSE